MTPRAWFPAIAALAMAVPSAACLAAGADCAEAAVPGPYNPAHLSLRFDNDALGSPAQDQGYSNGLALSWVSPDLAGAGEAECLGPLARGLRRYLEWRRPGGFEQQHLVLGISHGLYTPADKTRSDLIEDDRPYAGVLLLDLGYLARSGERLQTTHLRAGMVGPSAKGQEVQNAVHRLIDVRPAQGWEHQLRDEPLLQLLHERLRRWRPRAAAAHGDGWGWDAIGHAGASLGNYATFANAGAELRFGWRLPDDFGSDPQRPAGDYSAARTATADGWHWHAFVGVDGRAVLQDITLDGNGSKPSHSVDREVLVGDLGYGMVLARGRWKFTLAQYQRSREFEGQVEAPSFGSLSVSRAF